MIHLLLIIIYLAFISLGLPDSLLGSAWPAMYQEFHRYRDDHFQSAKRQIDQKIWNGQSYGCQCVNDCSSIVWVFHQPFLCRVMLMGSSLWAWRRKCGRFLE